MGQKEKRFGIIGYPVAHSKSPALFKAAYGGKYSYDRMEEPDFETAWKRFLAHYTAVNVTAPFKEKAFAKVLEAAREGRGGIAGPCFKIGAANLVVHQPDGGLEAYNSDFTGVILCLAEAIYPGITDEFYRTFGTRAPIKIHQFVRQNLNRTYPRGAQALIVGCGGAGRAAAVAAAELGFATALMNRTPEKAQALAQELPEYNFLPVPLNDFRASVKECDVILYTLPTQLDEIIRFTVEDFEGEDRCEYIRPGKIILEANYHSPAFLPVRERMEEAGCQYVSGERWLRAQAAAGYAEMTGEEPDRAAIYSEPI